jgi:(p)ppGpp synthase/HD superfamily hydrolase
MYSPRFEAALQLASTRHQDQRRKGGQIPYVTHLMHVSWLVAQDGGSEDEMIVALLHDVIEDTAKGPEELERLRGTLAQQFGADVLAAIESLSEPKRDGGGKRLAWRARKDVYLSQLERASPWAHRVAAADKLHNLATLNEDLERMGEPLWQRFTAGPTETLWFYQRAAEVLAPKLPESRLILSLRAEVERLTKLTGS